MESKARNSRPFVLWLLIILLFLMGIGAIISGPMLLLSPDGELIHMPVSILEGTPFESFLLPGIILILFLGIFPILVSYGLLKRPDWGWAEGINICKKYHWAWTAAWASGMIILIWIIVEIFLIGYISGLQPGVIVWGLIIIILTLLPAVQRYYRNK